MSGNPNRFDGAGAEDRSDRTDLLRLLREARRVIIQLVVLVQHNHRYPEDSVARSLKRQRVKFRADLVVQLRANLVQLRVELVVQMS